MKRMIPTLRTGFLIALAVGVGGCAAPSRETGGDGDFRLVEQDKGPALGYSPLSGVKLLREDGLSFKDLDKNGGLDPYEDWRLSPEQRASDLAGRLDDEEIAGLMLFAIRETTGDKPLSPAETSALREKQVKQLLIQAVDVPADAARWNNRAQAIAETTTHGIPVNGHSDPRHGVATGASHNLANHGQLSIWPQPLGLAATFDTALVKRCAQIIANEYRAIGITMALSPQIDLATEPRWYRIHGTFGESPELSTDLARAYVDGLQKAWGPQSVGAIVKHWPGAGAALAGRDGQGFGIYSTFPGQQEEKHKRPFAEGAFRLDDGSVEAAGVMLYYTIVLDPASKGKEICSSYNIDLIQGELRDKIHYGGIVCADWACTDPHIRIVADESPDRQLNELTEVERHDLVLQAGVDLFGGNTDPRPLLEAFRLGYERMGQAAFRQRLETSAIRLLLPMFRMGLFENPYLDPEISARTTSLAQSREAGYEAQLRSIVMLKNRDGLLPLGGRQKLFLPQPATEAQQELIGRYFEITDNPAEADLAIVRMNAPQGGRGYDEAAKRQGENGFLPISLQYGPYQANNASPARSGMAYDGKSVTAENHHELATLLETRQKMGRKPVIVAIELDRPAILSEIEPSADVILAHFGVEERAVFDIISGKAEPSALLPMRLPADMRTVEAQKEDVPFDTDCYVDQAGNRYDFAFGMNWKGVINDQRVKHYKTF